MAGGTAMNDLFLLTPSQFGRIRPYFLT